MKLKTQFFRNFIRLIVYVCVLVIVPLGVLGGSVFLQKVYIGPFVFKYWPEVGAVWFDPSSGIIMNVSGALCIACSILGLYALLKMYPELSDPKNVKKMIDSIGG